MKEYKYDISRPAFKKLLKPSYTDIILMSSGQFSHFFNYTIKEGNYEVFVRFEESKGDDIAVLDFYIEPDNFGKSDLYRFDSDSVIYFKFLETIEHIENILTELIDLDPELKPFFDELEGSEIDEDEKIYTITLTNGVSLNLDISNKYNYRIFDPTHLVTKKYTYPDCYTEWSMGDPYNESEEEGDQK